VSDAIRPAALAFRADGTPFSSLHDDIYHSAAGALAQARFVFLSGNGLPDRWHSRHGFTVLEMGFGMGINFLATWDAWRREADRAGTLHYVSVEKHPFSADDLRRAHAAIVDEARLLPLADTLVAKWPELKPGVRFIAFEADAVELTLVFADATDALAQLSTQDLKADAIFLDGFAPAKNPDMWSPQIFALLARLSEADATFATYTSAGSVKQALLANGFEYRKVRGFGGKRAMLVGKRAPR
jgi:tRNA U34 5-methylaminomethyl-2-thiouridine-forming methyltransferase MnmC